jgi:hypothetical protein
MTRRAWLVILEACLCATALSGCTLFSTRQAEVEEHNPQAQVSQDARQGQSKSAQALLTSHDAGQEESEPQLVPPQRPPRQRLPEYQDPPQTLLPVEPAPVPSGGQNLLQPAGGSKGPPIGMGPEPNEQPLVSALHCLLDNKPKEALRYLEGFDGKKQELIMRLLAPLAMLNDKTIDQLSRDEKEALEKQIQGLELVLRDPSELVITKMCLCERIDGYRQYKALPDGHVFQPASKGKWGERVLVYVELRDISFELRDNYYISGLHGKISIRDSQGEVWQHNFRDREPQIQKEEQPCSDSFRRYDFEVPSMPAGKYTLAIEITDELHEPHRVAHKLVEFVVGASSSR